jgi:TrmH family RNA methyltransferase
VRRLRRLVNKRSLRWSEGVCVLEGPDLIEAAFASNAEFEGLYVDVAEQSSEVVARVLRTAQTRGVRVFALATGVLEKIADAQTPQPLLATVRLPLTELTEVAVAGLVLVLHDVRDPGNAGTIIRSADAAGATAVIFTGQSVDPFNPKTLRASAGSVFHLPSCVSTLEEALAYFSKAGARTLATVVRGGLSHRTQDFSAPTVVVIGNEASGLDAASVALCDGRLSIPMAGRSESLNAGIAASLIAFEAYYQRQDAISSSPPRSLEGS